MSEPEDVVTEGALVATRLVQDLWARRAASGRQPGLADFRRRLELLTATVHPGAPEIGVAEPPAPVTLLARLAGRAAAHSAYGAALSSTDGRRIRLPGRLDQLAPGEIAGRYRLLALEQSARAARGTPHFVPPDDRLRRDLFLLAEAAAVDRALVRALPGVAVSLRAARAEALALRDLPYRRRASPRERAVEELTRGLLAADPATPPPPFPPAETPAASLAWAAERVAGMAHLTGGYRGVPPVPLWGTVAPAPEAPGSPGSLPGGPLPPPGRTRTLTRRPRVRETGADEDDPSPGTWIVRADDLQEKAEDPAGLMRPTDRDAKADPGELAESLAELPEARLVRTPDAAREVLAAEDPIRPAPGGESERLGAGIVYPEWDWRTGAYRARGAVVRERPAAEGGAEWAERALRRHAVLLRGVRRDFERLRPRRTPLRRQPDGAEPDIDAYVAAYADRRGGGVMEDRLYLDARPHRRDVAIALLADASASTDGWVSGDRRIIDVEKEALLLVCEALAALGDPHAVLAFSGEGPARVEVQALLRFGEAAAGGVRRRIGALEPGGYTRTGAALRHATAGLLRQATRHRLLLLLSDGRPNDVDQYEGRYGVEDTRAAVAEARLQGVHCFCLTVDREAPRYATRIFGRPHFAVLPRAERLPAVLTALLRDLVRG